MENIYDALFSSEYFLNEQLTRELFDSLTPDGAVMAIVDFSNFFIISNPKRFDEFIPDRDELIDVLSHVGDGRDPAMLTLDGATAVVSQLDTERTHCGYLVLVLPGYTADTTTANMDLIELIFAQANVISRLIEKNNNLHQKHLTKMSKTSDVLADEK